MLEHVEKISGSVIKVIFENPENMFRIIVVEDECYDKITCVGEMPPFKENDDIDVWGKYKEDPKYGLQLEVMIAELQKPKTKKAVIEFLSNSALKGVGVKTAEKIYDTFGEDSVDIVYEETERLIEVPGMTENKLSKIVETLDESRTSREVRLFLVSMGISYKMSYKIYDKYGSETIEIVKNNPYQLIDDFDRIGFNKADEVARNLGFDNESEFRISAGIEHVIKRDNEKSGNTSITEYSLVSKAASLLRINSNKVSKVISDEIKYGNVKPLNINNEDYLYSNEMYWAETKIAMILASKSECSYIYDVNIDLDYDEFADEQVEAIESAFKNMFLVITGGPGTGKTTIIKTITKILEDNNLTYSLVAPTGRAAKRMNESTGKPTSTIHRLIGLMPGAKSSKKYNENEPMPSNYIIVDEVSMVDTMLMKMLLMAISSNTVLILVGDSNQLPSVGPGNVLRDVINTNVKTVELKKIFRQSEESDIVINAHKINDGIYPVLNREDKGFYFVECDKDNFDETMLELIDKRLPEFYDIDKINDIQVLCPSKKSAFGTVELNKQLQNRLNPLSEDEEEKQLWDFRLNDKVMQTRNNYDIKVYNTEDRKTGVFNGDIGTVKSIDSEDELLTVEFEDGATVVYDALDAQNLELSYAITIHKSQGSEFKCVVIPVMPVAYMLLNRNLFYTAVTRAKENVVLVGDKNIIKKMVDNNTSSERITHLDYLLSRMI